MEIKKSVMLKFSVVIITLNEARNIGRCIGSVTDITDDIVVLDSFSTDETEAICLKHNVRFYQSKFDGYGSQKNKALTYAKHKWVLSLDADEAVSEELKQSIMAIDNKPHYDAYKFNRLTNYCGKWIKHLWYPDTKLRLWNTEKGKWNNNKIHEGIQLEAGARIKHIPGDLLHYSFYSIFQHIEQVNKFTELMAQQAIQRNKRSSKTAVVTHAMGSFIRNYFFRKGFLDGWYGFVISVIAVQTNFLKYLKIYELQKKQ